MEQKNWFEKFFSIDEVKGSSLILVLFVLVGFAGYSLIVHGDVPSNLTSLLEITIGAIAGVNAFSFVGNGFGMNKTQNGMPIQNQYGSQYTQYGTSSSYSPYGNSSMGMSGMNTMPLPMNNSLNPMGQAVVNTQQITTTSTGVIPPSQRGV